MPGVGTAGEKAFHTASPAQLSHETDGGGFWYGKRSGFPLGNAERKDESARSPRAGSARSRRTLLGNEALALKLSKSLAKKLFFFSFSPFFPF